MTRFQGTLECHCYNMSGTLAGFKVHKNDPIAVCGSWYYRIIHSVLSIWRWLLMFLWICWHKVNLVHHFKTYTHILGCQLWLDILLWSVNIAVTGDVPSVHVGSLTMAHTWWSWGPSEGHGAVCTEAANGVWPWPMAAMRRMWGTCSCLYRGC